MTQHTSTAQTWRDLADQLTPQQITDLDYWERIGADGSPDVYREHLIGEARDYIEVNRRNAALSARIAPPEGTTVDDDWDSTDNKTGRLCRPIRWSTYDAGATTVDIDGWQDETGAVDGPHLTVYGLESPGQLSGDDARRLAEALVVAAAALDTLTGPRE